MSSLFRNFGVLVGKAAAKTKNIYDLMGGSDEESVTAQIRLGRELEAAMLERVPLVTPNPHTAFVSEIGAWLAGHVKENRMPFIFHVTAEPAPNAFALPGGPIFVSWPLLGLCRWERDEVAFVLAHEMAHIVLRHAVERVVQDSLFSLLLRQAPGKGAASAWLARVGQQAVSRSFSRDHELEADAWAVDLLKTSGADALAGERLLWKLFQQTAQQDVSILGEYFSTHPPLYERLLQMQAKRVAQPATSSPPRP